MEFKLSRLASYEDEDLLEEMRRVAELLGNEPLTRNRFDEFSRTHTSTVGRRFEGWKEALKSAGLEDRWGQHASLGASSEEVLAELKGVAAKLGKETVSKAEFDEHSTFGYDAVISRFGSWKAAIKAAGLEENPLGHRYSDEACFENLFNVWVSHGRPPKYREMWDHPSEITGKPYLRFGSWTKALRRFVDWAESDRTPVPETLSTTGESPPNTGIEHSHQTGEVARHSTRLEIQSPSSRPLQMRAVRKQPRDRSDLQTARGSHFSVLQGWRQHRGQSAKPLRPVQYRKEQQIR